MNITPTDALIVRDDNAHVVGAVVTPSNGITQLTVELAGGEFLTVRWSADHPPEFTLKGITH